ncbi:MAG: hypothetical protein AAF734_09830, partial [Bacteroidota bacterium]
RLLFISFAVGLLYGCGGTTKEDYQEDAPKQSAVQKKSLTDTSQKASSAEVEVKQVAPFADFPMTSTQAQVGDYVLTFSLKGQQEATRVGADQVTFTFQQAKVHLPGKARSVLIFEQGKKQSIPNYMIIPLTEVPDIQEGDILLGWWSSGKEMQRCLVTDASDPQRPKVKYLDIRYDNSGKDRQGTPVGRLEEQLAPKSFTKLLAVGVPGSTLAVREGNRFKKATVVTQHQEKILAIGFAGHMQVYDTSRCIALPIVPNVKAGEIVQVPYIGIYIKGKVKKIDPRIGRVFTEIQYGGKKKTVAVAFGDVATNLPL